MRIDIKKESLKDSAKKYETAINHDLDDLMDRLRQVVLTAAAIGLSFWFAYWVIKKLVGDDSEEENSPENKHHTTTSSTFGKVLKEALIKQLTLFLLDMIKSKATDYINKNQLDESDTATTEQ